MDHSTATGPGLAMLVDNPLLILVIIFAVGGLVVFRMLREPAAPADRNGQSASENSASKRGA